MAEITEDWNGSDADGDGKLNLAEFQVWMAKAKAREVAGGHWTRADDAARVEAFYNMVNAMGEGDGVTLMEFFAVMGPWMAKYNDICRLSPALLEQIDAYATERYTDFKANATPEQQAFYWEFLAKIKDAS